MKVLCTQPRDELLAAAIPPPGSEDYLLHLMECLSQARETVDIACPFIDDAGVTLLAATHDRGSNATWSICTRTAGSTLRREATARGWQVFEYRGAPGSADRRGFHCKLFVLDASTAVVGSVNLVKANLVENAEVGLLVDDERVAAVLGRVISGIRRASERVA